ncbi:MAG: hypothetical protein ACI8SK_001045 [Shewanella sp.]|jgi:hypothetical protein
MRIIGESEKSARAFIDKIAFITLSVFLSFDAVDIDTKYLFITAKELEPYLD